MCAIFDSIATLNAVAIFKVCYSEKKSRALARTEQNTVDVVKKKGGRQTQREAYNMEGRMKT